MDVRMGPKPEQTQSSASRKAKQAGCDAPGCHAASCWPCAPSPSSARTIWQGIVLLSLVALVGVLVPSADSAAAGNHTEWRRPADGGKIQVPDYGGRVPAGYRTAPSVASPKTAMGAQAGTRRPGGRPLPTAQPGVLRTAGAAKSAAQAAARRTLQAGAAPKASAAGDSYPAAANTLRADTRAVLPAASSGLDIGATSALVAPKESQDAVNQSQVADTTDIGSTAGPDLATQATVAVAAEASPAASMAAANAGPAPDAPSSAGEGTMLVSTSQTDTATELGNLTALLPSAVPNSTSAEATTAASEGLSVEVDAASVRTNVDGGEATNATTDVTATVAATSPSISSAALGGGPAAAGVVLAANVTNTESATAPGNVTALLPPSAPNSSSAEAAPGFDGHIAPQPVLEAPLVPAAPHATPPKVHRPWGSWWKALLQAVRRRMPGGGRGGGRRRLLTTTAHHEGGSTATIGASLDPSNLVEATGVEPAADMPSSAGALPAVVNASETASTAALGNLIALLPSAVPNSTSVETSAASEATSAAAALASAEGNLHPAANSTDAHMMLHDTPTGTSAAAGVVLAANVTGTEGVMAPGNVTALLPLRAPNSSSVEAAPGFEGHIAPQPVLEAPLVPAAPHATPPKVHRSWGSWWKALLQAVRRRMPGGGRGGGRRRLLTTTAPHEGSSTATIGASLDPSNLVDATGVEPAADMPSSAGALPAVVNASETASTAAVGNLTALLPSAVPNTTSVETSAASEATSAAAALASAEGNLHTAANSTDAHMMLPNTPTGTPAAAGVVLAANVTGTESTTSAPGNVTALDNVTAHNFTSVGAAPGFEGHIAPQPVLEAPLVPAAPHAPPPKVHRSWGSWWKALLQAVRRRMPGGGRGGGRRRLLTTTAHHEGGSNLAIQLQFKARVAKLQPHARNPPRGAARRAPPKRTRLSHRDRPNRAMDRW